MALRLSHSIGVIYSLILFFFLVLRLVLIGLGLDMDLAGAKELMRGLLAWICFLDFITMYYNLFYAISMMMPIYTRLSSALEMKESHRRTPMRKSKKRATIQVHHHTACTCDSLDAECNENLVCSHWRAVQALAQSLILPIYVWNQRQNITYNLVSMLKRLWDRSCV